MTSLNETGAAQHYYPSTMTHWLIRRARYIALGILLAMTMQAVSAAALTSSAASSQNSIPVVLCTPAGMIVLSVDLDTDTDPAAFLVEHNGPQCIFCAAHHAVPAALLLSVIFLLPDDTGLVSAWPQEPAQLPDAPHWLRAPVRAPPVRSL